MGTFTVASYRVRVELTRVGSGAVTTVRNRILELASAPEAHEIVETALLNFSTSFESWSGSGVVGYYAGTLTRPVLYGWLPASEFTLWYDVVRSEQPLTLSYTTQNDVPPTYITDFTLGTSTEPLGEGPHDVSP